MRNSKRIVIAVIGGVLVAIGFIKLTVIGYYPSELPPFIAIVVIGGVLSYIASKMPAHIEAPDATPTSPSTAGSDNPGADR